MQPASKFKQLDGFFVAVGTPRSEAGTTITLAEIRQAGIANALRRSHIFAGISWPEANAIAEITVIKSIAKGGYLFHEGDPSAGFYIVQAGAINVHRINAAGKEQVIHVFRAGESFGETTLATAKGYLSDARALVSSQVLLVQKAGFLGLLGRHPKLALRLLASTSEQLQTLVGQIEALTSKDVETRLADWLVERCPDPASARPTQIKLSMTKRMLAAELGTVSETLSRTLAKLREQRLISVNGRVITLLDPPAITAMMHRDLSDGCAWNGEADCRSLVSQHVPHN